MPTIPIRALILNCTLKPSPEPSHTEALIKKVKKLYRALDVKTEVIRVVDHNIPFGISSNMGKGDAWPSILKKILKSEILIMAMPIWFGVRSSVAQMVIERLDGTYEQGDKKTGQFPLYNTVGGAIVTGNEDGAHDCLSTTLFNLSHLGCTIPPNADTYWLGPAGPGPSYIDADGDRHMYTNKTARFMVHNTVFMAKLLKKKPINTNLNKLIKEAEAVSEAPCGPDMS